MKTKYKYIEFEKSPLEDDFWECLSRKTGDVLCLVVWSYKWESYASSNSGYDSEFDPGCLRDIADFLEQLNKEKGVKNGR